MTSREQVQDRAGYRWVVLAAVFLITFMTMGTRSTLGVFFKSIIDDLGRSRGTLSMLVAVNIWLVAYCNPSLAISGMMALIGASLIRFGIAERRYSSRYAAV